MRQSFLQNIAQKLWEVEHENVGKCIFVFPNQRAGKFFRDYLLQTIRKDANHPKVIFAPKIMTVNQLFTEMTTVKTADNIDLLFRLYQVYQKHHHTAETFDDFVFWGRMMLSDFNEVDQHLVDAKALFSNLRDLKKIEATFATDDETASINAFIEHMSGDEQNKYKQKFLTIWDSLYDIYNEFRNELQHSGIAYTGMLQRNVVEGLANDEQESQVQLKQALGNKRCVFIGFNALTKVERRLMKILRDASMALFFWDYQAPWLRDTNNRASKFHKINLQNFSPAFELDNDYYTHDGVEESIHLLRIPSFVGQAQEVRRLLLGLSQTDGLDWRRVGVILPDENMLLPIKNALPGCVDRVNITMGQPLHQTPIYAYLVHLSELVIGGTEDITFYYKPLLTLLNHPYVQSLAGNEAKMLQQKVIESNTIHLPLTELTDTLQSVIFIGLTPQEVLEKIHQALQIFFTLESLSDIDREYIYQTTLIVNRLSDIIAKYPTIAMQPKTLFSLLIQLLDGQSVPFEGEPLQGLQIMGVLESRSMSFDTVIITDVNEEKLPGKVQPNTYIPYDLRLYYKMPTSELQDAIFAYNFYRLISHAKTVYLLQNTLSNDTTSGDASRFVYQLQYQYHLNLNIRDVSVQDISTENNEPPVIAKTPEVLQRIENRLCQRGVSPSSLNVYVKCPLHFYWETICGIRESKEVNEEIEANQLGTVLHNVMEGFYGKPQRSQQITEQLVDEWIKVVNIKDIDHDMIAKHYLWVLYEDLSKDPQITQKYTLTGKDMLAVNAIRKYVLQVLEHDRELAKKDFFYELSEEPVSAYLPISNGKKVKLHGKIDRVDVIDGITRIVDYKTGSIKKIKESELAFEADPEGKYDYLRQTLLYALMYTETFKKDCSSIIYYTRNKPDKMEVEQFASFKAEEGVFLPSLRAVLDEIFDASTPFLPNPDIDGACKYCPFTTICGVK